MIKMGRTRGEHGEVCKDKREDKKDTRGFLFSRLLDNPPKK